ncbi:PH domain-containing protein [Agromyces bracchium]|uniref:PH domain-containing protein n=1 Tax=Agromyces bracchium TaxID=88376 RepID=A0A6I3M9C6_9MICO|nr:PH domain-containing protein [Agromyces bracchium]
MIDFQNGTFVKLSKADVASIEPSVRDLYVDGETSMVAAKGMRDFIMFTNKRIIAVNVQGMTGKKRDTTSLPYSKIQVFSIETAGTFDRDAELEIWLSGLGRVRLEFAGNFDVGYLAKLIGWAVL